MALVVLIWAGFSAARSSTPVPVYAAPVQDLIDELGRLPGVGPKSAQRIAFYLLKLPAEDALRLARSIESAKARVSFCRRCFNVAEGPAGGSGVECEICLDSRRDPTIVCVVEEPRDVVAVEKTGEYRGRYHVLGGKISPTNGVGPEDLRVTELESRLSREPIREIIVALGTDVEGDATGYYLAKRLAIKGVKVSRIAHGLPAGSGLEFADELTLSRALEGRREMN